MSKSESNISYINHDMRNHISVAISYFQLLTIENPELKGSKSITAAVNSLNRAIELSQEIAEISDGIDPEKKDNPSLSIAPVKEHLNTHTKPAYKKMKNTSPIAINDTYELLNEEKHIAINPIALNRLRENILNNAINAGATKLDAHYEMMAYCIIVTFSDDGRGMRQEDMDKIMLSQHGDGKVHGIGTQYILETVENHGFFVSYSSKECHGTTVRILCPYVKA